MKRNTTGADSSLQVYYRQQSGGSTSGFVDNIMFLYNGYEFCYDRTISLNFTYLPQSQTHSISYYLVSVLYPMEFYGE